MNRTVTQNAQTFIGRDTKEQENLFKERGQISTPTCSVFEDPAGKKIEDEKQPEEINKYTVKIVNAYNRSYVHELDLFLSADTFKTFTVGNLKRKIIKENLKIYYFYKLVVMKNIG